MLAAPGDGPPTASYHRMAKRLLVCHESGLAVVESGKPEILTPVAGGAGESVQRGEFDWSPDESESFSSVRRARSRSRETSSWSWPIRTEKRDGDPEVEGGRDLESVLAVSVESRR